MRLAGVLVACALLFGCGGPVGDDGADGAQADGAARGDERPNIVLITADDLGYSDLGAFGGEIPTPSIDSVADSGLMMTQFYASPAGSPTRAMLFSGMDSHVAGLGTMAPVIDPTQQGQPGYEGYLNLRVASLANLLQDAGYGTYMTGRWDLGAELATGPVARGFDRSFVAVDGASHLGGLSWAGPGPAPYLDGEEFVNVGDGFYSTRFYTERMIEYLENGRDDEAGRPFFAYLAYTAPHFPLQAPPDSIAKFEGRYRDGYEALYERRLERAKELGLAPPDLEGVPPLPGQRPWSELGPEERRIQARKMEIYAALVSDLDAYVGRFIDYLESIGELDDTFIFFMSSNGPEGVRRDLMPPADNWIDVCCDNRYENLGSGDSYILYGPGWARAGSAPFRGGKATTWEGGIRVPAIARWPGRVPAGARSDAFATVMDLYSTLLALAGTEHPGETYMGRPVEPPLGESLLPVLTEQAEAVRGTDDYVGWELFGYRAVRQGDWKIVWDPSEGQASEWHLYNLAADPGELRDLREAEPERLAEMTALWERYQRENGVILPQLVVPEQ